MPPHDASQLDVARVLALFERRVADVCGGTSLALRLSERLRPEQWALEWHLPWWLGRAFGLDDALSREIVLSNLLGLASLRLKDDLADGDTLDDDGSVERSSAALYREALAVYLAQFDRASPFWTYLETRMSEWESAIHGNAPAAPLARGEDEALAELARRGAPLKIPALAVCLLTNRMDAFPTIEQALDRALTAMVLYDDVCDWEADLFGGRWNAFVAGVSALPQLPRNQEANRFGVLVAMMTRDAVETYFARIHVEVAGAVTLLEPLGLARIAAHLRELDVRFGSQGLAHQAAYRSAGDRAAKLLVRARADAPS